MFFIGVIEVVVVECWLGSVEGSQAELARR
jgi:hypothetical protein